MGRDQGANGPGKDLDKVIRGDRARIQDHLEEMVCGMVEMALT